MQKLKLQPWVLINCGLLVVAFQANFLPIVQPHISAVAWRTFYYGFWIVLIGLATMSFFGSKEPWRAAIGPCSLLIVGTLFCLTHHLDVVEKNFIAGNVLIVISAVSFRAVEGKIAWRMIAAVTVFNTAFCLIDAWLPHELTYDGNRAAGLFGNPNDAAICLLLGALLSFWSVPEKWRASFWVFLAAGLFATVSRSTMLIGVGCLFLWVALYWFQYWRLPRLEGTQSAILTAFVMIGFLSGAVIYNHQFALSIASAAGAVNDVDSSNIKETAALGRIDPTAMATLADPNTANSVTQIITETKKEGQKNSILARLYVFVVAFKMFLHQPWTGYGLSVAHSIAPHNNFLLFAVAYGIPGLLIPVLVLGLLLITSGLLFTVGVLSLMLVSHDIQLVTSMVVLLGMAMGSGGTRIRAPAMSCD